MSVEIEFITDTLLLNLPRNTLADFSVPKSQKATGKRLLPYLMPDHTPDELKSFWKDSELEDCQWSWSVAVSRGDIKNSRHALKILAKLSNNTGAKIVGLHPHMEIDGVMVGFASKGKLWPGIKGSDPIDHQFKDTEIIDWRSFLKAYPKIKAGDLQGHLRHLYVISKDLGPESGLYEGYAELVRYWQMLGPDLIAVENLVMDKLNPTYDWQIKMRSSAEVRSEYRPSRVAQIRLAELAMRWWKYKNPMPLIVAALRDDYPNVADLLVLIEYFEYYNYPADYAVPGHVKDYWFSLITKGNTHYGAIKYRKRNRVGRPTKRRRGYHI